MSDLAIGDREYRDVPVGVRGPGRNDSAFGGVLEHHHAGLDVVMMGPGRVSSDVISARALGKFVEAV